MKHVIIVGHPNPGSFNLAIAHAYEKAARELGHDVLLRDLYRLNFDPALQDKEIPRPSGFSADDAVKAERDLIRDADVFAFIYPLWFNFPPAIVVGYVQRVFTMGFGYGPIKDGGNQPLLAGRRLLSFSTSGAPASWVRSEGAWDAIKNLFDAHLAGVCGMTFLEHVHYGSVLNQASKIALEANLTNVEATVKKFFGSSLL